MYKNVCEKLIYEYFIIHINCVLRNYTPRLKPWETLVPGNSRSWEINYIQHTYENIEAR